MALRELVRASACPASSCSISSLTLAAIICCLVLGFLLAMVAMLLVLAVLLMVLSPLPLLFMPCAACTYMPNASWRRRGGKAQGERVSPTRGCCEGAVLSRAFAEQNYGETPCAAPGQSPQPRFGFLNRARLRTGISGSRCGRNRPLWWVAEDAKRLKTGRNLPPHGIQAICL